MSCAHHAIIARGNIQVYLYLFFIKTICARDRIALLKHTCYR